MGVVSSEEGKKGHSWWRQGMTSNLWSRSGQPLVYFVGSPPWAQHKCVQLQMVHTDNAILNWAGFFLSGFCFLLNFSYFSVFGLHYGSGAP